MAFQQATHDPRRAVTRIPRLLLNVLNGGAHAYTNPVRADVPELMLLARSDDLVGTIESYRAVLEVVRRELAVLPRRELNGTLSMISATRRPSVRSSFCDGSSTGSVSATASQSRSTPQPVIGGTASGTGSRSTAAFANGRPDGMVVGARRALWNRVPEDPFAETDRAGWADIHAARPASSMIVGDNFTSTSVDQLVGAGKAADLDAVIAKPNQNGTISGTLAFAAAARDCGLGLIVSHRSIETESTFLVDLAVELAADGLKIGPFRDFTAVIKANELLRRSAL